MPFILLLSIVSYMPTAKAEGLGSFGDHIFRFQEKMANKGDVLAQYKLGTLYEFGVSVKPDIEQARHWYQLAAKSDYQPAINRNTYLDIKSSGFDPQKHKAWLVALKQQADSAEPNALILLGQMHRNGIGVTKNLDMALDMLSHASALGHTEIDSEIDAISLEIEKESAKQEAQRIAEEARKEQLAEKNEALQQQKLEEEKRKQNAVKQKETSMEEKRRRYDEAMRKIQEEQRIIEEQQKWVESQQE